MVQLYPRSLAWLLYTGLPAFWLFYLRLQLDVKKLNEQLCADDSPRVSSNSRIHAALPLSGWLEQYIKANTIAQHHCPSPFSIAMLRNSNALSGGLISKPDARAARMTIPRRLRRQASSLCPSVRLTNPEISLQTSWRPKVSFNEPRSIKSTLTCSSPFSSRCKRTHRTCQPQPPGGLPEQCQTW